MKTILVFGGYDMLHRGNEIWQRSIESRQIAKMKRCTTIPASSAEKATCMS